MLGCNNHPIYVLQEKSVKYARKMWKSGHRAIKVLRTEVVYVVRAISTDGSVNNKLIRFIAKDSKSKASKKKLMVPEVSPT